MKESIFCSYREFIELAYFKGQGVTGSDQAKQLKSKDKGPKKGLKTGLKGPFGGVKRIF
ncbi:hypothetical protein KA005_13055 [bacterium]|nr:hypothetical protein [bacterium]